MAGRWVVAFLALGVAGCLPSRDNPHDPAVAPAALLQVIDHTVDGGCAAVVGTAAFPEVAAASRGRCLALDARGTTDPQQTRHDDLTFTFTWLGGDGSPDIALASSGAVAILDDEQRRETLPALETLRFRVRVEDPGGASATDDAVLVLLNERPVAVAPPRRALPLHGFPWAPDAPIALGFDGESSFDPDDDPLDLCWTFGDGTRDCSRPSAFADIATDRETRFTAALEAGDGDETGRLAYTQVTVRAAEPWIRTTATTFSRIELEERQFSGITNVDVFARIAVVPGDAPALVLGETSVLIAPYPQAPPWPLDFVEAGWLGSFSYPQLAVDSAAGVVWALGGDGAGGGRLASIAIEPAAGGGIEIVDGIEAAFDEQPYALALDGAGNAWVMLSVEDGLGPILPDHVAMVKPDGAQAPIGTLPAAAPAVLMLAGRPQTGEVWAMAGPTVYGLGDTLVRFETTTEAPRLYPLPFAGAFGLAWVDRDRFWTFVPETGLVLVDAEALESGSFQNAIVLAFPEVLAASDLRSERLTGDAWLFDITGFGTGTLVRASLDGTLIRMDAGPTYGVFRALDDLGYPILVENSGATIGILRRAALPRAAGGIAATAEAASVVSARLDPLTGGIWVVREYPNGLVQLTETGGHGRAIFSGILPSGEPSAFPPFDFRISPDGTRAWAFMDGFNGVELLALDADPVTRRPVLDGPASGEVGVVGLRLVPTRSSFAWAGRYDFLSSRIHVQTVTTSGQRADIYTVPASEGSVFSPYAAFGESFADDSLCLATGEEDVSGRTISVHVRRVTAAGATDLATIPTVLQGFANIAVATTEEDGKPVCWIAIGTNDGSQRATVLAAVDLTPSILHRLDLPGESSQTLWAVGTDRAWVSAYTGGPERDLVHRVDFVQGALSSTSGHLVLTFPGEGSGPYLVPR